jgi:hypothetical protein
MLAIAFIVIAFAEPVFRKNDSQILAADALTTIYIDNSFSMMAEGENGRLFEEAVSKARELVSRSARDTRFVLLTNEAGSGQRRILTKEATLNEIDRLEISPASRNLSYIVSKATSIASEKDYSTYEMYIFSDFQKNHVDLSPIAKDTSALKYLMPMTHLQKRNIYIDSCWLSDPVLIPNRKITLNVRLKNSSDLDFEKIPLKLRINGQQKAVAGVDIIAGGFEIISMSFSARQTGWHYATLEIEDFPITFDDRFYFTFNVKKEVGVLEIGDEKPSGGLALFYGSDSLFSYQKMDYRRVKYDELFNFNLIILNSLPSYSSGLNGQLMKYTEAGGNLMFIPSTNEDKTKENQLLASFGAGSMNGFDEAVSRVVGLKKEHALFRESVNKVPENADFPVVFSHFRYGFHVNSGIETLIRLLNGDDFLATKKIGNGHLYLLAAPLDRRYTNFASHPLFVPVMYGAAVEGDAYEALFRTISKDQKIVINSTVFQPVNDQPVSVKKHEAEYTFIPEQQFMSQGLMLNMHDGIETDGFYDLIWDEKPEYVFAYNYDRAESQLEFYSEDELREQIESEGLRHVQVLSAGNAGYLEMLNTVEKENQLWKLFIIFALLLLLAEILVLRFWK